VVWRRVNMKVNVNKQIIYMCGDCGILDIYELFDKCPACKSDDWQSFERVKEEEEEEEV